MSDSLKKTAWDRLKKLDLFDLLVDYDDKNASIYIGPFSNKSNKRSSRVLIKLLGKNDTVSGKGQRKYPNNQIGISLEVNLDHNNPCFTKDDLYDEDYIAGGGYYHEYRFYHFNNEDDLDNIIEKHVNPFVSGLHELVIRDGKLERIPMNTREENDTDTRGDNNMNMQHDKLINEIKILLKANHNIVLHGAPGTGKTYLAQDVAKAMGADEEQIGFVQFHPSYDYTDFVEGLRPVPPDEGNKASKDVQFERKDGVFKEFCKKAIKNPDKKYIFIIDEINRGNMSKIFGELFYSIDPGYRVKFKKDESGQFKKNENGYYEKDENDHVACVKTQYQNLISDDDVFKKGFYVPENVYIIGTMNDIDRSVECMDFAFRRRFVFKEIKAADNRDWLKNVLGDKYDRTISVMDALNRAIYDEKSKDSKDSIKGLDASYHIGAAYFAKLKDMEFDYDKLWDLSLKPLLNEYVRGNRDPRGDLEKLEKAYNEASKGESNDAGEENSSETTQS